MSRSRRSPATSPTSSGPPRPRRSVNLAGIYRTLANARTEADRAGTISQATWDSITPHEVTIQQTSDRLRALLHRTVQDLPLDEDAGARHEAAERLLTDEVLGRNLRLLVLAEQSRLLWRSLKLEHIRRTEPDALVHEAVSAQAMLEENAGADRRLIETLRTATTALGRMGRLDGFRIFTRDELPKTVGQLRAQVDEFAATRHEQSDVWAPDASPTLGDAWSEAGAHVDRLAGEARQAIGRWLESLGGKVKGGPDSALEEPAEVRIEAAADGTPEAIGVMLPPRRKLHHLRPVRRDRGEVSTRGLSTVASQPAHRTGVAGACRTEARCEAVIGSRDRVNDGDEIAREEETATEEADAGPARWPLGRSSSTDCSVRIQVR